MGTVSFDGQAPFALPVTQSTKATVVGDRVEACIRCLTTPRNQEDVIVSLSPHQAIALSSQLTRAALDALSANR